MGEMKECRDTQVLNAHNEELELCQDTKVHVGISAAFAPTPFSTSHCFSTSSYLSTGRITLALK
jgi:hypothetical protein